MDLDLGLHNRECRQSNTKDSKTIIKNRLRVYPASFAFREDIEIGDKILLPQSALNELYPLMSKGPLIFCLANLNLMNAKRTFVGVL